MEIRSVYQELLDQKASCLYHTASCSPEAHAFQITDTTIPSKKEGLKAELET